MSTISILITASGFIGVILAVFVVFFEVKKTIKISANNMIPIIAWLILFILGIVNLYYMHNIHDEAIIEQQTCNDIVNDDQKDVTEKKQNDEDQTENGDLSEDIDNEENKNLSEEELLIAENYDLIQELKKSYSEVKMIENSSVKLSFFELAGYIYSDIRKTGKPIMLNGINVIPSKVIILDYYSDKIIYNFSSIDKNSIEYASDNQDVFYCIIFHENYNLYVTQPIKIVEGDEYNNIDILLNKESDEYTSLFQVRAHSTDFVNDESYLICSPDNRVSVNCKNKQTGQGGHSYYITQVLDTGILSYNDCNYFSIQTEYIIDFSLYENSDLEQIIAKQTIEKAIVNSNIINIYFDIDKESIDDR